MKILICTPVFPPEGGGPARYSWELLRRLGPEIDVRVISFSRETGDGDPRVTFVSIFGTIVLRQAKFFWKVLSLGIDSDLIYLLEPAVVGLSGLLAGKLLGKRIIVKYVGDPAWEEARRKYSTNDQLPEYLASQVRNPSFLYRVTKLVLGNSDSVVVPAKYLRPLLNYYYQIDKNKIKIIPNSVEIPKKVIPKKKNSLIVVARLVPWKNIDLVVKAVSQVRGNLDWRLTVLGDGPERKRLVDLVSELGISQRVNFTAGVSPEEAIVQITAREALILFSDYEGQSHVVLESLAAGTTVIASDISANREVLKNGQTGILVKPKDTKQLTVVIEKVLRDDRLREELISNGRTLVKDRFSWEKNLTTLRQLFYEVLKKP